MIICEPTKCIGCTVCISVCPVGAISAVKDIMGFTYPKVDSEKCINCLSCRDKCPVNKTDEKNKPLETFAAYSKSRETREKSSSGGIFSALANNILHEGGAVVAAAFDDEFRLYHRIIESDVELSALRGSKYLQSETAGIWEKIKEILDSGVKVLFCGTPCQCAGLDSFLDEKYDNLLTVDVFCHGVPSPKVWEKYIRENFSGVKTVIFRDKTKGWYYYGMKIEHKNGSYYSTKKSDPYSRIFLTNCALRESCYNCEFKGENCYSDITLGDFWGIEKVLPSMDNGLGTSAVIIHTEKGKAAFNKIEQDTVRCECTYESIIKENASSVKSTKRPPSRDEFEKMMNSGASFSELAEKFGKPESKKSILRSEIKYRLVKLRNKCRK